MQACCPFCKQEYDIEQEHIGMSMECSNCGKTFQVMESSPQNDENNFISFESQYRTTNVKEYKVLTQKDKWFSGKFDPELLEKALNSYAAQGWRVVSAATATFPAFIGGNREEMIVILERDK